MTPQERARKIANLINSQKFSGLLEDLLTVQFDEACEPWMHSVENLRRRAHDNEARIALLEAALEKAGIKLPLPCRHETAAVYVNVRTGKCTECGAVVQVARAKVKP